MPIGLLRLLLRLLLLTGTLAVLLRSAEGALGGAVGRRPDVRRAHAVRACDTRRRHTRRCASSLRSSS